MSTVHMHETHTTEEYLNSRDDHRQRYPSTNSSTPNSSGGDKQFHFSNANERSGQNSRTSSFAESITASINTEGFSNFSDIIQHLQTVWFDHNNHDGSRRSANSSSTTSTHTHQHHSKGHSQSNSSSQQYYNHHQLNQHSGQQYWHTYSNPRRSGNGNYTRNYSGGNNDLYWNPKNNRFPSHRSMNNLMTNAVNYQQQSQSSPPTQRRQGDQQYYHNEQQQPSQSYYKKNRSDHDRRQNGYAMHQQHSVEYSTNNSSSEQSNISSTQSYPSNLNSYNR